ncbi:MAG: hypothetical protein NVS1B7_7360 [Candidatus Saccharimonadales bacterium]
MNMLNETNEALKSVPEEVGRRTMTIAGAVLNIGYAFRAAQALQETWMEQPAVMNTDTNSEVDTVKPVLLDPTASRIEIDLAHEAGAEAKTAQLSEDADNTINDLAKLRAAAREKTDQAYHFRDAA